MMTARPALKLCIDASNLRAGGTVTHLTELLRAAQPEAHGFREVIVFAGSAVLARIEDRPWLTKTSDPLLEQASNPFRDRRHLQRAYWQRYRLPKLLKAIGCDLLFVPGGMDNTGFHPMVTMSRNMLPFDEVEARRYGHSLGRLRLFALRRLQAVTFRRADGLIFLTDYARRTVLRQVTGIGTHVVIPHGVSQRFRMEPRRQRAVSECSAADPFRILYVSTIDVYKHQLKVMQAVAALRREGLPVVLSLVGHANGSALQGLQEGLQDIAASATFIEYLGPVAYEELQRLYHGADMKVFASSCENMPNILVEAMSSGLPIACSNRGPMPEVLAEGGVYFDPESVDEIHQALSMLIESPELRAQLARCAHARAAQYSWQRCAGETFTFLSSCVARSRTGVQPDSRADDDRRA